MSLRHPRRFSPSSLTLVGAGFKPARGLTRSHYYGPPLLRHGYEDSPIHPQYRLAAPFLVVLGQPGTWWGDRGRSVLKWDRSVAEREPHPSRAPPWVPDQVRQIGVPRIAAAR